MLTKDGVWARIIFALCFFILSGSRMVTGWPATLCGILGAVELATGVYRNSPLVQLFQNLSSNNDD